MASDRLRSTASWTVRIWSVVVILFFGAMFLGHAGEFMNGVPPLTAWIKMTIILFLLAGFIIAFKWRRTGAIISLAALIALLIDMYISITNAGRQFHISGVTFILAALPPALINLVPGLKGRKE